MNDGHEQEHLSEAQRQLRAAYQLDQQERAQAENRDDALKLIVAALDNQIRTEAPDCEQRSESGWEWRLRGAILRVDQLVEIAPLIEVIAVTQYSALTAYSSIKVLSPSGNECSSHSLWYGSTLLTPLTPLSRRTPQALSTPIMDGWHELGFLNIGPGVLPMYGDPPFRSMRPQDTVDMQFPFNGYLAYHEFVHTDEFVERWVRCFAGAASGTLELASAKVECMLA